MSRWLSFFVICFSFSSFGSRQAVVLIPGTFSPAALGHYFSQTIQSCFQNEDLALHVVSGLEGTASFETNGERALASLRDWYYKNFPRADVPINLVAHSAGGFYALYSASVAKDLPIKKIFMISTPLEGSTLAEKTIPSQLENFSVLDLRGLVQLKRENVQRFLQDLKLDFSLKIFLVGAQQPLAALFSNHLDARYLSPAMEITGRLIGQKSDGIIETASAMGFQTTLMSSDGSKLVITRLTDLETPLEHPEQVLSYRIFQSMGSMNSAFIDQEQKKLYGSIAKKIADE